jgi:hypothetical protein
MLRYAIDVFLHKPLNDNTRLSVRPETIESLFIAYRLTGDNRYRDHGWDIFQAIERHCRIDSGGYTTIINVDEVPTRKEDKMETFFLVSQGKIESVMNKLVTICYTERNTQVPLLVVF